jgi:molybdenum cofactor biosynthesis protein B
MPGNPNEREFKPLNIAVMTVSDTRTEATDKSGDTLVKLLTDAGHALVEKRIIPDDIYQIRAAVSGG